MNDLIRLTDVSLKFGDQVILNNSNLKIERGDRVCLIGRNGAGKSSTLKLVTGELLPDDGKIELYPQLQQSLLNLSLIHI